jgi:hypothetical protein
MGARPACAGDVGCCCSSWGLASGIGGKKKSRVLGRCGCWVSDSAKKNEERESELKGKIDKIGVEERKIENKKEESFD